MTNKWLTGLILILFATLAVYEAIQDTYLQTQINQFMAKGPRFTAFDGQELCERIQKLEQYSYSYQDAQLKPLSCNYNQHR